jgi:hypothetical protein
MADKKTYSKSGLPIRKTLDFLPKVFQTPTNDKFLGSALDPMMQPGSLEKTVGYVGKKYGKTFNGKDIYVDTDETLRSRYQLEPAVTIKKNNKVEKFYDYLDFKNIIQFFGNENEKDNLTTGHTHYSWNPPIDWDKFINYREYFWVPTGPAPIAVYGQSQNIISTYKVSLGTGSTWIFTPDGFTNNPAITLYRGQTYKFVVSAASNGFFIRRSYDTKSLEYSPDRSYQAGELVVFDDKLWRAKRDIFVGDGSTIDSSSQDWEQVEDITGTSVLDYTGGITNNGTQNGTITFKVPLDSPDVLYYQSGTDPDRFGRFIVADVKSASKINVEKEVIGKVSYTSSNGIEFSNGMVVTFEGQVTPEKYAVGSWVVEGVGSEISLTAFEDLVIPVLSKDVPEVYFDNDGFDTVPFDDASAFPGSKDYITINKSSKDANPWSRYNRWFHRSVLEYSSKLSGSEFSADETARAKRPIIEFNANIQLFNHGSVAKATVDFVDDFTTDVFSQIEGSKGYIVDGEPLFEGARLLVINDSDSLANNRIYRVSFITHNNVKQISLVATDDTESVEGEVVLIRLGSQNKGKMFWYNGTTWQTSQPKTLVNQPPLFDLFNEQGNSFSNSTFYTTSTFAGSKILSYKIGTGANDPELGFPISYLNISNVGDIQFVFDFDVDNFNYTESGSVIQVDVNSGYYKVDSDYKNSWTPTSSMNLMPIIDSYIVKDQLDRVVLNTVNWEAFFSNPENRVYWYLNGNKFNPSYQRKGNSFFLNSPLNDADVVSVKLFCDLPPDQGYYELPITLERNPFNQDIESFTLGQAKDHIESALEFNSDLIGNVLGTNNLRDLTGYTKDAKRFIKHAGIPAIAVPLLCDKNINVIKSISYAKKSYNDFKARFLQLAEELYQEQEPIDFVDIVINEFARAKTSESPFANSDMIGSGSYTTITYEVEDTGINTFALNTIFSLSEPSNRAVYVYIDKEQLLYGTDYTFNENFGFVIINKPLTEGTVIEIREYTSSAFNHIPPTPTKLGLHKKYTPQIFVDDTYITPRTMIQGHDGSLTTAYGDYRDNVLLELEKRIYNNCKVEYNTDVFDLDYILGGYYKNALYDRNEYESIISKEFLKWISDTSLDFIENKYFDSQNSFTYTYTRMTDPTQQKTLPGWWRGVYRWAYDTDRPHMCPWEMLGFSEKPNWWETEYGPAPYTSNNLILWEDIEKGIIRQGNRQGIDIRYARPGLLKHIPVDADGKLLSPLNSNFAQDFSLVNNDGDFVVGDHTPIEHSWYISSEYPFAKLIAVSLLRPFEFVTTGISLPNVSVNKIGQVVSTDTNKFVTLPDLYNSNDISLGYYVKAYLRDKNLSITNFTDIFENIDINLSHRLSGFVDPQQHRFLLDSKSPRSTSANIFLPIENQQIVFNVSSPIRSLTYSAVLIEKTSRGYRVNGYDNLDPYFRYYKPLQSNNDPLISVGGVSEGFVDWVPEKFFGNGIVVRYDNAYYRSLESHQSTTTFDNKKWKKLPDLPKTGASTAYRRRLFNSQLQKMSYGTILTSNQQVIDFLLGYEHYLETQGFSFEDYDTDLKAAKNWTTSSKEFLYWTQHNWANGALISLSPSSQSIKVKFDIGVPENLLDGFYDYKVYGSSGNILSPSFINFNRSYQSLVVETTNTDDGIYLLKIHLVLKEHVVVFDDRSVFNDVLYDKTTGYRQERIKVRGFRTVDWDGDYTSPGFLYDAVNIKDWQPFVDYKLGDIVSYKGKYWTSQKNHTSSEVFEEVYWYILDLVPNAGLIPNFDFKINQFDDFYNLDADGLSSSQRDLGRHAIGYQTREYLQSLAEDDVTQFSLYQGFIREKGTSNSIVKIFDKLSKTNDDSIILNEEWAFRIGTFGGIDQLSQIEFDIRKTDLQLNPQPVIVLPLDTGETYEDQFLRIYPKDFINYSKVFDTNIIGTADYKLQTPGYVKLDHVNYVVKNLDDILSIDITKLLQNDYFYVTFGTPDWNVLRFYKESMLDVVAVSKVKTTVTLNFDKPHNIEVGEIIGSDAIVNLVGFFKVSVVGPRSVSFEDTVNTKDPEVDYSSLVRIYRLAPARFSTVSELNSQQVALLPNNSKLWLDKDDDNGWKVYQKNKVYNHKSIADYGTTTPLRTGKAVVYSDLLSQTIVSRPEQNSILVYVEGTAGLHIKQVLVPGETLQGLLNLSFGNSMSISPDSRWLAVGAPFASGINSAFVGEWNPRTSYVQGNIVVYGGKLWKALINIAADPLENDSSINIASQDWEPIDLLTYNPSANTGRNYLEQGAVILYRWNGQGWVFNTVIISPRPNSSEQFGHAVAMAKDSSNNYWLTVSAPGSQQNRGRVYIMKYEDGRWKYHEDEAFMGIYDPTGSTAYPEGSIVWFDNKLWRAKADSTTDGSSITINSNYWTEIDPVSTQSSLPTNVALEDDGSTLINGLLGDQDLKELTKQGEGYGYSLAMNKDGSVLVVGAPDADNQYFARFRGEWDSRIEYSEGDVVSYKNSYYKLVDAEEDSNVTDSSITSKGQDPAGLPWLNVGDSTGRPCGKIYIYVRSATGRYELKQTVSADNIQSMSAIDDSSILLGIQTGDKFGHAIDIDANGNNIVVGSPFADAEYINQGLVYVFNSLNPSLGLWDLKTRLEAYEQIHNLAFGSSLSISSNSDRIVVGARNSGYSRPTNFTDGTTFDKRSTTFSEDSLITGMVYVYERISGKYFLAEKLEAEFIEGENFGASIDTGSNVIVVASPQYKNASGVEIGMVRSFRKDPSISSLEILSEKTNLTDIKQIRNVSLIDTQTSRKICDVEVVDGAKLKLVGTAEEEIKFKTPYDPAIYTNGNDNVVVDSDIAWFTKNTGTLWWDLSTAKWNFYEQGDISYRINSWNTLAKGSSIDVYEWVETKLLPSEWAALADTTQGLANGISGQPLYPNDDVYSVKVLTSPVTGKTTDTLYYYWVKASTIIPDGIPGRTMSSAEVASLIENPTLLGSPIISFIDTDKFLLSNFYPKAENSTITINVEFYSSDVQKTNLVHQEYQLLTEGVTDSLPAKNLESKWLDSLVGFDQKGQTVPDPNINERRRYGISIRPRQSMFKNRLYALKQIIENINGTLLKYPFSDIISFDGLNDLEESPSEVLNEYDLVLDTLGQLEQLETTLGGFFPTRIKTAVLKPNIINGEIDTIDIVDPGFGYQKTPFITIEGGGEGATATIDKDSQGRIIKATVVTRGKKYDYASVKIRNFSVLVKIDETVNGFWSIYSFDPARKKFYRSRTQAFDNTKYWYYSDWWKDGYSISSRIVTEISEYYKLSSIESSVGDLIKIKEYGSGGWAILERVANGTGEIDGTYSLVARYNGTIQLSNKLYDQTKNALGYDLVSAFDDSLYDSNPSIELRNLLHIVRDVLFTGDLRVEWNKLFFNSIRYVFSEQASVDWAFKTSFVNVTHNVGELLKKPTYKNDNLSAYQDYLNEVKPYRTTLREYTSRYVTNESTGTELTDFDLPPYFDTQENSILPTLSSNELINDNIRKYWRDNNGFSVSEIRVSYAGGDYTSPPKVIIEGNGIGAEARAYISNGRVSGIRMISEGSGYTATPTITLVGGNGSSVKIAKAVAILGNSKIRNFDLTLKFDRINKLGLYSSFTRSETIIPSGRSSVYNLKYAPTYNRNNIRVYKNNQILPFTEYDISFFTVQDSGYTVLKGKISFDTLPSASDSIYIEYSINDVYFDAVNRINRFYLPTKGMIGNELDQLMTGIDFGGVQVQGNLFEVTGGWDALPWFSDGWDSVEPSGDFYIVARGSTTEVTLPEAPTLGQLISIYIKRYGTEKFIRIDDPYFDQVGDSSQITNLNAIIPSIVGDGSTTTFQIHEYVHTEDGDVLIFRPFESDGAVNINDPNILDTDITGGTFESFGGMFTNANGFTAEEISITGGQFTSPEHVPATEENVPGQVLDSLSIKVYQVSPTGSAIVHGNRFVSDGSTSRYDIGVEIFDAKSVLVYVDGELYNYANDSTIDYTIDFSNNQVLFGTIPPVNSFIEIIGVSKGGIAILSYETMIATGNDVYYITKVDTDTVTNIITTIDGIEEDLGFTDSSVVAEDLEIELPVGKATVRFAIKPPQGSAIKFIVLGQGLDTDSSERSLVRVNTQQFVIDDSSREFELNGFVNLTRGSAVSSMIVELNQKKLKGPDTYYAVYNGTNNTIIVGSDPLATVTSVSINVFINGTLQPFVTAYIYNGATKQVVIREDVLSINDVIKVEVTNRSEYFLDNNKITLTPDVEITRGDIVNVTWFSEYPSLDMISDIYQGGQVEYHLKRIALDINYLWVYHNGNRLQRGKDYTYIPSRNTIKLNLLTTKDDIIDIVEFGNILYKDPRCFEIFKDMTNKYLYKRHCTDQNSLSTDLTYFDTSISVTDPDLLDDPIPTRNIPGVIKIGNERIEYMQKIGNVLSGLRRGTAGTPINNLNPAGTRVVNVGISETIPYADTQETVDFLFDGSTRIIGPLGFVPTLSTRTWEYNADTSIPAGYGPCDTVEVFVGGRRLRKDPIRVYDESLGPQTVSNNVLNDAEFSVDGVTEYIRLTDVENITAGTKILVVRKIGKIWYDRGETTASTGYSLLSNNTPMALFIDKKRTELP